MNLLNLLIRLLLLSCFALNLSGCDQVRTRLADLISPESPEQSLKSINQMIDRGHLNEALSKTEKLMDKSGDLRGQFELSAARIAVMQGNVDLSIRYLARAIDSLGLSLQQLMDDEAFNSIHSDTRFLQLLTKQTKTISSDQSPSSDAQVKASDDTHIKITNKSTEVRAGDLVIKLPN